MGKRLRPFAEVPHSLRNDPKSFYQSHKPRFIVCMIWTPTKILETELMFMSFRSILLHPSTCLKMSSKIRDSHSLRQRWKPFLLFLFFFFFFLPTVSSVSVVVDSDHAEAEKRPPQFANEDEAGVQPTQIILDERERLNLKCPLKSNASYIQWTKGMSSIHTIWFLFLQHFKMVSNYRTKQPCFWIYLPYLV